MRAIVLLGALALPPASAPLAAQASATPAAAPLTLERLEQMASANSPTLRQARAGVDAARARARQAGAWPNPIVGYTGDEISSGPVIRGGEHGFFVEQAIPLGGKLRLGRTTGEGEVAEASARGLLEQQRLRASVRSAYYEVLTLERRIEVDERLSQLGLEAVEISRQLFNVGIADRPDVLESEVAARRAQLEATAARNARFAAWRRLAAIVGDPSLAPQPLATTIDAAVPELDRPTVLQTLLSISPELVTARAAVTRARAAVSQARRATFPDLFLRGGGSYNRERLEANGAGSPQPVGWESAFQAGVSVPLFNRNAGGVAAALADQTSAEAEVRRLELSIESRLATAFDGYLTSLRSAEAYRDEMLPRAEDAYRLYLARYRESAAAYPQVLMAQRTLFELTDEYLRSLEAAWRAAVHIEGFLLDDDERSVP
jgi:cobalt-zinc-cadmium efflux system outer membrane protein